MELTLYDQLKKTLECLPDILAYNASVSKPTPAELKPSSFNHKTISLRGHKYHYVEEGDPNGTPVILLHGFPDLWYGWRHQIRHLAKHGYRVFAIDNLGSGGSDHPRCSLDELDPYLAVNLSASLVDFLDQLNIEKAVFAGHDWGGYLVWQLGQRYPERCHTIISLGDPYRQPTKEFVGMDQFVKQFPHFAYWVTFETEEPDNWFDGDVHKQAQAYYAGFAARPGTNIEEMEYYIDQFTRTSFHGGYNYYRAFKPNHEEQRRYIGKPFTVPALQVIIEQDQYLTPEFIAIHPTHMVQHLEQIRIEKGGHCVQFENPEHVNKVFTDYLSKFFSKDKSQDRTKVQ
ncbi:Bifunctional epoxide hydrolase 2 [Lobosporangium transversale]|uniref:Alpha/Beta hydrolase protein n=1 Tax=Lobosporangium transversale TaxID=64571 RepID=A0A1Y2GYS1_9FUNG|nr:Alpha/Beta hydrolase protein [Lobosporangium transversale]KAF9903293.1 Bifunctional epoxide hydrolase 2 [Lobosporangium transversale]ORZ27427.1 Alpha/Beta hydrolase protein [Lobosporangium transversale]|eukprot:XP_021885154.1 Alpha/Beta hydrolase protein [Lobosporangium transversale]